jgi:hypothetical protein
MYRRPDGKLAKVIHLANRSARFGVRLSFARITDKTSYEGYRLALLPVRSEELVELTKRWGEFMKEKGEESRTAREAGPPSSAEDQLDPFAPTT